MHDLKAFLKQAVPPPNTPEWATWRQRWQSFGPDSAGLLLDTLQSGTEGEQYAALLGLRELGYEAYAEGYGSDFRYRVVRPRTNDDLRIVPSVLPADFVW